MSRAFDHLTLSSDPNIFLDTLSGVHSTTLMLTAWHIVVFLPLSFWQPLRRVKTAARAEYMTRHCYVAAFFLAALATYMDSSFA